MRDISTLDYSALDRPEILGCVFHPRREWGMGAAATAARDVLVPVGEDVVIGGLLEHIEMAGVHSGDATLVLPPQSVYISTIRRVRLIAVHPPYPLSSGLAEIHRRHLDAFAVAARRSAEPVLIVGDARLSALYAQAMEFHGAASMIVEAET